MKLKEKLIAIQLRKSGQSYREIQKKLKVSKGTLSLWLREVKLTLGQIKELYIERRQRNAYKLAKLNQRKRISKTKKIIKNAKNEFKTFFKSRLFLSGLMLYWAEGDKSDEREVVKFSNSDPKIIKLIMRWFREICKVPDKKFRVCIHIHVLHCRKNIEKYWSRLLHVPLSQFYRTQVKPTSLKHRKNKLYNGTCAISVGNKDLFRRIKGWKLEFIENIESIK